MAPYKEEADKARMTPLQIKIREKKKWVGITEGKLKRQTKTIIVDKK